MLPSARSMPYSFDAQLYPGEQEIEEKIVAAKYFPEAEYSKADSLPATWSSVLKVFASELVVGIICGSRLTSQCRGWGL